MITPQMPGALKPLAAQPQTAQSPTLVGPPSPQTAPVSPVAPPRGVPGGAPPVLKPHILTTMAPGSPNLNPQITPTLAPVSAVSSPPVSANTAPAGSTTSQFGPGHDLLSTQINPNTGGPNRTQLAQNSIASWEAQNAPALASEQRTIGQNAAKFGRIGAGMTTNDLTGAQATYDRNRMDFQNQLASGLANGTIADQQNANDQLRQERAYQTNRSDQAIQNGIQQQQLQDQLQNSSFGRALDTAQFGYGNSPVDTLGNFSNALGQTGAASTAAGVGLMSGANKQPAPIDWSSILQRIGGGGTQAPAAPAAPPVVRNY